MSAFITLLASFTSSPFFQSPVWKYRLLSDVGPWIGFWQQRYPVSRIRFLLLSERAKIQQQWEAVQRERYQEAAGGLPKEFVSAPPPFPSSSSVGRVGGGPLHPSPAHAPPHFFVARRDPTSGVPLCARGESSSGGGGGGEGSPLPTVSRLPPSTTSSPSPSFPTTAQDTQATSVSRYALPSPSEAASPPPFASSSVGSAGCEVVAVLPSPPPPPQDLTLVMRNCEEKVWELDTVVDRFFQVWWRHAGEEERTRKRGEEEEAATHPHVPPPSSASLPLSDVECEACVKEIRHFVRHWVHRGLHVVRESWSRAHTGDLLHLLLQKASAFHLDHLLTPEVLADEVRQSMWHSFQERVYEYHPRFFCFFATMVLSDTSETVMDANWLNDGLMWLMEMEVQEEEEDEEEEDGAASSSSSVSSLPFLLSPARLRTVETFLVEVSRVYPTRRMTRKRRGQTSTARLPARGWEGDGPLSHTMGHFLDGEAAEGGGGGGGGAPRWTVEDGTQRGQGTSPLQRWEAQWTSPSRAPLHSLVLFPPFCLHARFRPLLTLFVCCAMAWGKVPPKKKECDTPHEKEKEEESGSPLWDALEGKRRLLWALLTPLSCSPPYPFLFQPPSADASPDEGVGHPSSSFSFSASASRPPFCMGVGGLWMQLSHTTRQQLTTSFVECQVFDILFQLFCPETTAQAMGSGEAVPPSCARGKKDPSASPSSSFAGSQAAEDEGEAEKEEGVPFVLPLSPSRSHAASDQIFHLVRSEVEKRSARLLSTVWKEEEEEVVEGEESASIACEVLSGVLLAAYLLHIGSGDGRSPCPRTPPTAAAMAAPSRLSPPLLPHWQSFPWVPLLTLLLPAFHVAVDSFPTARPVCEQGMMDETRLLLSCMAVFGAESVAVPLPACHPVPPSPSWSALFAATHTHVLESCTEVLQLWCTHEVLSEETFHQWHVQTRMEKGEKGPLTGATHAWPSTHPNGGRGEGDNGSRLPCTVSPEHHRSDVLSGPSPPFSKRGTGSDSSALPSWGVPSPSPHSLLPPPMAATAIPSSSYGSPEVDSLSVGEGGGERPCGGWRTPQGGAVGLSRRPPSSEAAPLPMASPAPFRSPSVDNAAAIGGKPRQGAVGSSGSAASVPQAYRNDSFRMANPSRSGGGRGLQGTPRTPTFRPPTKRWGATDASAFASTTSPSSSLPSPYPPHHSLSMPHPYAPPLTSATSSTHASLSHPSDPLGGAASPLSRPESMAGGGPPPPPHTWDVLSAAVTAPPFIPASYPASPPSGAMTPLSTPSGTPPVPWGGRSRARREGNTGASLDGRGRFHRKVAR